MVNKRTRNSETKVSTAAPNLAKLERKEVPVKVALEDSCSGGVVVVCGV